MFSCIHQSGVPSKQCTSEGPFCLFLGAIQDVPRLCWSMNVLKHVLKLFDACAVVVLASCVGYNALTFPAEAERRDEDVESVPALLEHARVPGAS